MCLDDNHKHQPLTVSHFPPPVTKALLFVIKDHPREVSIVTSEDAQSALYALLTTRYGIAQPGATPTPPAATAAATAGGPAAAAGAGSAAAATQAATSTTSSAAAPAGAAAPSSGTANGGAVANGNVFAVLQGSSASSPSATGAAPMEVDAAAASPDSAGSRGKVHMRPFAYSEFSSRLEFFPHESNTIELSSEPVPPRPPSSLLAVGTLPSPPTRTVEPRCSGRVNYEVVDAHANSRVRLMVTWCFVLTRFPLTRSFNYHSGAPVLPKL